MPAFKLLERFVSRFAEPDGIRCWYWMQLIKVMVMVMLMVDAVWRRVCCWHLQFIQSDACASDHDRCIACRGLAFFN